MGKLTDGALAFGLTPLALAATAAAQEQFKLSIGVRETGTASPIGGDGDRVGTIEFVNQDALTLTADGTWQQFTFNFGTDPVSPFTGDGALSSPTNPTKGTFEQIRVLNFQGTTDPIRLYVDNVVHTVAGNPITLTDFEGFTGSTQVMFRHPGYSGSTTIAPAPSPNQAIVSTDFAQEGTQSYKMTWAFADASPTRFLRLTTDRAPQIPNPTIDFANGNSLSFWALAVVDHPLQGWITNGDGNWNDGANWADGAVPNGSSGAAKFLGTITAPVTVSVDLPVVANNILFDNANRYTIDGLNGITMEGTVSFPATISTSNGSHTFSAPLSTKNNLSLFVSKVADTLTFDSLVKDAAAPGTVHLSKTGPGTVVANTLSADSMAVSAGAVFVLAGGSAALALPAANGTSLIVSSGAVLNVEGNSFSADKATSNGTINHFAGATTLGALDGVGTLNVSAGTVAAASIKQNTVHLMGGTIEVLTNGTDTGLLRADNLTVADGAVLAMNDNDFIVNYGVSDPSPEFTLRDKVKAFADNPAATSGISFTQGAGDVTIAVAEKTEWGQSVFNGVTLDDTTVIGQYTYYGDSNLDGAVTSDDYVAVDVGLGTGDSWVQGDFNFSGSVTSDDYVAIDVNLGKGTPTPLAWAELKAEMVALHTAMFGDEYVQKLALAEAEGYAALVPEPGTISLLGIGLTGLLGRRRRPEREIITH